MLPKTELYGRFYLAPPEAAISIVTIFHVCLIFFELDY
jgi:hypothetical protein